MSRVSGFVDVAGILFRYTHFVVAGKPLIEPEALPVVVSYTSITSTGRPRCGDPDESDLVCKSDADKWNLSSLCLTSPLQSGSGLECTGYYGGSYKTSIFFCERRRVLLLVFVRTKHRRGMSIRSPNPSVKKHIELSNLHHIK